MTICAFQSMDHWRGAFADPLLRFGVCNKRSWFDGIFGWRWQTGYAYCRRREDRTEARCYRHSKAIKRKSSQWQSHPTTRLDRIVPWCSGYKIWRVIQIGSVQWHSYSPDSFLPVHRMRIRSSIESVFTDVFIHNLSFYADMSYLVTIRGLINFDCFPPDIGQSHFESSSGLVARDDWGLYGIYSFSGYTRAT